MTNEKLRLLTRIATARRIRAHFDLGTPEYVSYTRTIDSLINRYIAL